MIIKIDCFLQQLQASPCFHLCCPLILLCKPWLRKHMPAPRNPSLKQASSKSTGDIIVTLFFFCSPWAALTWLCQSNNNLGKWMNSITVPEILRTTMVIPLGFMNMARSVLPFGECFNAPGHQKHITAQKHNTLCYFSSTINRRSSLEQAFRNSLWTASLTHTTLDQEFFLLSKVKRKFTMTFRLIHSHLTSFYSGCLRKAWYSKFEVRGGRMV